MEFLPKKILEFSDNEEITEEYIYYMALNLRNSRKIPFYPRSIGFFESYSIDIHYCIEILKSKHFLDRINYQITTNKAYYADPSVIRNIDPGHILHEENLLQSCIAKIENKLKYNSRICNVYNNFLEEKHNYLFTHLGCLDSKFGIEVDLKQAGIDNFRALRKFELKEKAGKREYEKKILSILGKNILDNYDKLFLYSRLKSLEELFQNNNHVRGKLVAIMGIFNKCKKIKNNFLYEFRDSIILDKFHKINVLFGDGGKFTGQELGLLNTECLLIGFVDSFLSKAAIRAAGVIKIDEEYSSGPLSSKVQKTSSSQQTDLTKEAVRERNGGVTYVEGGSI